MAAVAGIWNHTATAQSALSTGTKAMSATPDVTDADSSTSSTTEATISANDFLTLLVTEMQNQDPTADTDPNEYINQLVNVNSLEQLIQINQTLSSAAGTVASGDAAQGGASSAISAASPTAASNAHATSASQPAHSTLVSASGSAAAAQSAQATTTTYGNLTIPKENPSALRVSKALDGQRITR